MGIYGFPLSQECDETPMRLPCTYIPHLVHPCSLMPFADTTHSRPSTRAGHPRNLTNPGTGVNMGDGWETARRLDRPAVLQEDSKGHLIIKVSTNGHLSMTASPWLVMPNVVRCAFQSYPCLCSFHTHTHTHTDALTNG